MGWGRRRNRRTWKRGERTIVGCSIGVEAGWGTGGKAGHGEGGKGQGTRGGGLDGRMRRHDDDLYKQEKKSQVIESNQTRVPVPNILPSHVSLQVEGIMALHFVCACVLDKKMCNAHRFVCVFLVRPRTFDPAPPSPFVNCWIPAFTYTFCASCDQSPFFRLQFTLSLSFTHTYTSCVTFC